MDPTKFNEGQKAALESLKKTKDSAGSTAKELEARGAQAGVFFDKIAGSALKLGAIFLAGLGLKDFVQYTVASGAAVGRMAYNIGLGTEELGLLGNAVEQIGGNFGAAASSAYGLSQGLQQFALTGQSSIIPFFRAMHISLIDAQGHIKTVTQLYADLNRYAQTVPPQQFNFIARSLGLDQDTINLLEKSPEAYQAHIEAARRAGVVSDAQSKQLQRLQQSWVNFDKAAETAGRNLLVTIVPALEKLLDGSTSFIEKNSTFTSAIAALTTAFGALATAMKTLSLIPGFGWLATLIPGLGVGTALGAGAIGTGAALQKMNKSLAPQGYFMDLDGNLFPLSSDTTAPTRKKSAPLSLFDLVQHDENSAPDAVSSVGAVGRNQIMPNTAKQYGFDPNRLKEPDYNDMVARAIEADLNQRYHGDLDAITIAYHNGPGAADAWLRGGRNDAMLGPQSRAYLSREREAAGGARATTTTTIGAIYVNAPQARDAAGIAGAMRAELAKNSLVVQSNPGTQ